MTPPTPPENFSSTAFHNPCSIREDRILIFQRVKLVPPLNFGTSYFADDVGTWLDVISSQITHEPILRIFHAPCYCWFGDTHPCWPTRYLPTPAALVDKADCSALLLIRPLTCAQSTGLSDQSTGPVSPSCIAATRISQLPIHSSSTMLMIFFSNRDHCTPNLRSDTNCWGFGPSTTRSIVE